MLNTLENNNHTFDIACTEKVLDHTLVPVLIAKSFQHHKLFCAPSAMFTIFKTWPSEPIYMR